MQRIVSLLPSATEIVAALGYEHWLVARSHECDFPPSVTRLPICSEPRIDISANSREIDRQVKQTASAALSIFQIDAERLRALEPTIVITQTQCEVCAVSLNDVKAALGSWADDRLEIVALHPTRLADLWDDIRRVASALGDIPAAERLIDSLQLRLNRLSETRAASRSTVGCIEWLDPLMSAGNWVPELVELAGGQSVLGSPGEHSPWLSWDELVAADPDVLIVMPCGFDLERTLHELPALTQQPRWPQLRAVQTHRVFAVDGHQYFNRPGPRLIESAEIIASILQAASDSTTTDPRYQRL